MNDNRALRDQLLELLREAMLLADHNAYHLGQLVDLRRLLGVWPPLAPRG